MTTETRQRIRAYKRMLPELRERVIAVALLFAMSASMLGTASFAWLTLSRAPEVSSVNTTIAANGNLEIALATGNGSKKPDESQVGDSSAAEGQSLTEANITWGNMINLSDPSYGLDYLVLRPAVLNTAELLTNPLWGAEYSLDGRVKQMNDQFGYTSWQTTEVGDRFDPTEDLGVRAISSLKADGSVAENQIATMLQTAKTKNITAAEKYQKIATKSNYMNSLATMMGMYMTATMNKNDPDLNNPEIDRGDIGNLAAMYEEFLEAMLLEAEAIAGLVNSALHATKGENNYVTVTSDRVLGINGATALKDSDLADAEAVVTRLSQFQTDYATIAADYAKLNNLSTTEGTLLWSDSGINQVVNNLVNVGQCTVGSKTIDQISSSGKSELIGYLMGTQEARITNGILYRFEERTGGYLEVKGLSISAKAKLSDDGEPMSASVKANVKTSASREYNLFTDDQEATKTNIKQGGVVATDMTSLDTYGLAIDFWVRTNAQSSYLKLEGNVLSNTIDVPATGTDINGKEVQLYSLTTQETDEEGNTVTITQDVYAGSDGWLSAATHDPVTLEEGVTPAPKLVQEINVYGYEGVNRVWNEKLLSTDVTTQGSGSCYVYYADTPEDQERSLKLLEYLNVAFISAEGKKLATATMDVASHYAENGRVVVPLKLDSSDSVNLGTTDLEGNPEYAITELQQNTPTRITAIVYLNGTELKNENVLSAADIQGQLNIQLGSSKAMIPVENLDLESKYLTVSASINKTEFDWDNASDDMTSRVTLTVDGAEPSNVTAFFMRAINDTQGTREKTMTFTEVDGQWVADYTFQAPGNYVLRTVRLDGADYQLKEPVEVSVAGFAISSVSCDRAENNHLDVRSAESATSTTVRVRFASNDPDRMPKKLQGRFTHNDGGGVVNIDFTYNATTSEWVGTARFLMSGNYTLKNLILDGNYTELAEEQWQTASITLGMRVVIYTSSPQIFQYTPSDWTEEEKENRELLHMQVKIQDNAEKDMKGLTNVKLTYTMRGSSSKKMDTDLEWNGTYYVGSLPNGGAGIWQFNNVTIDQKDVLTQASTAPTFTIQAPKPPDYYAHKTKADQFAPDNDATMNVQLTYSNSIMDNTDGEENCTVWALIKRTDGSAERWVSGKMVGTFDIQNDVPVTNWEFEVPKDANGYQDGNWVLTDLKVWDVFAADGTQYTEESPLQWDLTDTDNKTKVISRVIVEFPNDESRNFGKEDTSNVLSKTTGAFLESHVLPSMAVTIHDFENMPISGIKDVTLKFAYQNGTSQTYGGYTRNDLNNATEGAMVAVGLEKTGDTTYVFTENENTKLLYAGNYYTTLSFTVDGVKRTYTNDPSQTALELPDKAPKFTVWSVTPAVAITSISPTGTINVDPNNSVDQHTSITVPNFTSTNATVYFKCDAKQAGSGSTCSPVYHNYARPSVTLSLSGFGNASNAELSFGSDVHIYNGSTKTTGYSWTENGTCVRNIGYFQSKPASTDTKTGAGTLTANSLVLNGSYTVTIPTITISNPY